MFNYIPFNPPQNTAWGSMYSHNMHLQLELQIKSLIDDQVDERIEEVFGDTPVRVTAALGEA